MSSVTASSTRSSSPASSDSLSDVQPTTYQPVDFSAWIHPFSPDAESAPWNNHDNAADVKFDDASLLMLDELVQDNNPFEPITPQSPVAINPAVFQTAKPPTEHRASLSTNIFSNFASDNLLSEPAVVPDLMMRTSPGTATTTVTRVVPPPPVQHRKIDPSSSAHRVIFPSKESCQNLVILTPNVPPSGTKSRVETQVRVSVDLAVPSGSSFDPCYDRVGSWKWLKLPPGTATRKRSRKEGKIDASPVDTLRLEAEVTCSSNPSKQVTSCSTCQGREAKRVARKIAARIRPARSDSENEGSSSRDNDVSANILQFNCPDTLDFSSGSVVLPLRITCYCRHHREKVGFNVHFSMLDHHGRIVGKGMSPPIMITDDHKSTGVNAPKQAQSAYGDVDWEPRAPLFPSAPPVEAVADPAPARRRSSLKEPVGQAKKRTKPYDTGRSMMTRSRRSETLEGNIYPTVISTSSTGNPYPDTSSISPFTSAPPSLYSSTAPSSPLPFEGESLQHSLPSPPSSNRFPSPIITNPTFIDNADAIMEEAVAMQSQFFPLTPPITAPSSPPMQDLIPQALQSPNIDLSPFTFPLMHTPANPANQSGPMPIIHRLIPSSGPTFGGIEVTVLGSNFDPGVLYNCVFGDVVSSSTTRWSENTLVCVLPPRVTAGVVPVTLEGVKADDEPTDPVLFTYTDESDRSLMELALQVVGLKMTGKIEDAKDIAMRIVGSSNPETQQQQQHMDVVSLATYSAGATESRRILLSRTDDAGFEKLIMDSLSALDSRGGSTSSASTSLTSIISHTTPTGQTMLHLAAFLNFPSLVEFLIHREIDLNVQDNNGCTALHFAALARSQCCARLLVNAGADILLADDIGRVASELVPVGLFDQLLTRSQANVAEGSEPDSDEESQWGDVEEFSGDENGGVPARSQARVLSKRRLRLPRSRRSSRAASVVQSEASDNEADAGDVDDSADIDFDDGATIVSPEPGLTADEPTGKAPPSIDDEKRAAAASYTEYFQRAWAQFQPGQRMPQMPHMPQLPGMPAWVFPIFVPMPAWRPPFRNEKCVTASVVGSAHGVDGGKVVETEGSVYVAGSEEKVRSPKVGSNTEWSASWETWTEQMNAAMASQGQFTGASGSPVAGVELLPFVEGESDDPRGQTSASSVDTVMAVAPAHTPKRSLLRRFGYGRVKKTEQEANAYPQRRKRTAKFVKKEDRMLLFFWIPALILAFCWAVYMSYPFAVRLAQHFTPFSENVKRLTAH